MLRRNIGFTLIPIDSIRPALPALGELGSHTMNRKNLVIAAVMLLSALAAASSVEAQTVGAHLAMRGSAPRAAAGMDPNTFIVGHPAGLTFVHGHANHEHPAVATKREAPGQPVDSNQFIVQPPAAVHWAPASEPAAQLAALR